ncbi:RNA exonuclease 3 [Dendryphion nanum]|uniref:RNA exonuclease 3 n=1 Tax=Dendryphion nanum TaxID=256645 RepID=A0A9P9IT41_9PLEO|nr:RNA exonuclease 3 [Dendryphion nanum]
MWPSAPSFRPFGHISCPAGANCQAVHCIFSHDTTNTHSAASPPEGGEREAKRIKLEGAYKKAPVPVATGASPQVFTGVITRKISPVLDKKPTNGGATILSKAFGSGEQTSLPRSATKPVSPPSKGVLTKPAAQLDPEVRLTPRKLKSEPAQFTKRLTLLKALRQFMAPLNSKLMNSKNPIIKALHLTENQLNKLAVDEEASIGEKHLAVYENVLKQRLVALKKMAEEEWIKERKEALAAITAKENAKNPTAKKPEEPKPVQTGLTPEEEVMFLQRLISPQKGLDEHGYVTKLPSEEDIDKTRQALAVLDHWEICDRCNTRFQVFPDRRQDGALTTGGKCTHHWGKKRWPKKEKGQIGQTVYNCCNEPIGSPGCTTYDTHVFKISDPKRLSIVMPFVNTPENDKADPNLAVCFDCEMGYTTQGLELLRLTAVSWPSHKPILDVLVRPLGHLLDVNTRFSGVSSEQFINAAPFNAKKGTFDSKDLRIVDSPRIARDLFLSLISPQTPLLGHALENDLNTIRIVHPTIVDTIILYPHPRGLPVRNGLKNLVKHHLGMDIQTGGAAGHDSFEDARATGELVRHKVATEWKKLKSDGWIFRNGSVFPPMPTGKPPPFDIPPPLQPPIAEPMPGEKRGHDQVGTDDEDWDEKV